MTAPARLHGHDREYWERMCTRKTRYADEYLARAGGLHVLEVKADAPKRLFVYRCENCRGWHLTRSWQGAGSVFVTRQDMFATNRQASA